MQFGGYVAALEASAALADPTRRPTTNPGESAPDFNTRAHTQLLTTADPGAIGNVVVDAFYRLGANGQETHCVVVSRAPGAGAGTRPAWAWVSVGSALSPRRGGFAWVPVSTCSAAVASLPSGGQLWTAAMLPKGAILGTPEALDALFKAVPASVLTASGRQVKP
jgi:hypothetical protein